MIHDQTRCCRRLLLPAVSTGSIVYSTSSMPLEHKIDSLLRRSVEAGDVPGVVAMATNAEAVIYEGAFGKRALGGSQAMTLDTVVWIASMTKAITGAAVMQLVERGKLDLDSPAGTMGAGLGVGASARGLRRCGCATHASAQAARHCAPSADTYGGLRLSDLERGALSLLPSDGSAQHGKLRDGCSARAVAVRSWRALGLRHQPRMGRQGRRSGQRQEVERLSSGEPLRSARHDRYRVQDHAVDA